MGVICLFSRRRGTWNGEVDTMIAAEDTIFTLNTLALMKTMLAGINVNKAVNSLRSDGCHAMSIGEFRDQVARTLITGQKHAVPEINEMAAEVKRVSTKNLEYPLKRTGLCLLKAG